MPESPRILHCPFINGTDVCAASESLSEENKPAGAAECLPVSGQQKHKGGKNTQ